MSLKYSLIKNSRFLIVCWMLSQRNRNYAPYYRIALLLKQYMRAHLNNFKFALRYHKNILPSIEGETGR